MPRTTLLLMMISGTMASLSAEQIPALFFAGPRNAPDVVEKNVRQLARIRIATAPVLSTGEPEGAIDLEGKATEIMLAYYRPATALQIAQYYRRELERRHATVLFQCDGRNCGLGGFPHWPLGYSSYAASNSKAQVYIAARITEGSGEEYVTVHAVENTGSR